MLRRVWERKRWILPGGTLESIVIFPSPLAPFWAIESWKNLCSRVLYDWKYLELFPESSNSHLPHKYTPKVTNRSSNSRWQCVQGPWLSAYSSELPQDRCSKVWSLYKHVKCVFSASASASVSMTHLGIPSAAPPPPWDSHGTLMSLPVLFSNMFTGQKLSLAPSH